MESWYGVVREQVNGGLVWGERLGNRLMEAWYGGEVREQVNGGLGMGTG